MKGSARTFAAYAASVAVSLVVGIAAIPPVVHFAGAQAWAELAVTQSIAPIVGVFISVGWGVTGPSTVAMTAAGERPELFRDSLLVRLPLMIVLLPVTVVASLALTQLSVAVCVLAGVVNLLPNIGASWYFVGEARPLRLLVYETLPRAAGMLCGLIALSRGWGLLGFLAVQTVWALAALAAEYALILRGVRSRPPTLRRLVSGTIGHRHGVITAATAALYVSSPLIVATAEALPGFAVFALAYKLYTYALAALAPITQLAQGWIPAGGAAQLRVRSRTAVRYALGAGLVVIAAVALLLRPIGWLFSDRLLLIGPELAVPFAVAAGAVVVSQVVGLAALAAAGRMSAVARSTVVGAVVGLAVMIVGGWWIATPGVAIGSALAELAVTYYQISVLRRWTGVEALEAG